MEDATKIGRLDHFVAMKSRVSNSLSFACRIRKDRTELLRQVCVVVFVKASEKVMRYCLTLVHLGAVSPEYKSIVIAGALLLSGRKKLALPLSRYCFRRCKYKFESLYDRWKDCCKSCCHVCCENQASCSMHFSSSTRIKCINKESIYVGTTVTTDLIQSDLYFVASSGGCSIFDRIFTSNCERCANSDTENISTPVRVST